MNVRLSSGEIRFRVTPNEMDMFRKDQRLVEEVVLPGGMTILLELRMYDAPIEGARDSEPRLTAKLNQLTMEVHRVSVERLATPSKKGIVGEHTEGGRIVSYSLEVDVKKQRPEKRIRGQ